MEEEKKLEEEDGEGKKETIWHARRIGREKHCNGARTFDYALPTKNTIFVRKVSVNNSLVCLIIVNK